MSYHPRGHVKAILDAMALQDRAVEWTTEQVAAIVNIAPSSVSTTLKAAIRNELLFKQKRGIHTFYCLTSYEPQAEPPEFKASLWTDGEIVMYGVQHNTDGSVTLTKEHIALIRPLVMGAQA